jgi:4-amino-4-deoxy-L-arabinose transferase-like glycosyltransferase
MRRNSIIPIALLIITAALLVLKPAQVPPLWFDEGWDLSVARNWVETGQYAQLLMGNPISASMLNTGLPAIAPIALSFHLFGVGIWQGRLSGGFFVLATLALLYYLARRLYNPQVAIGTLLVTLLMSAHPEIHPILIGRQGLGEMPLLFYILAGYASFLSAWRKPGLFMPLAIVFWGLALMTKPLGVPFLLVSLVIPLIVTLLGRRWKSTALLASGLSGSLLVYGMLNWLQRRYIYGENLIPVPIPDLYSVTAIVPLVRVRWVALLVTMAFGLPTVLGLGYAARKFIRHRDFTGLDQGQEVVRMALLVLAGSWLTWYAALSVGWARYLFPPVFIGSLFVAAFLQRLLGGTPSLVAQRKGVRFADILLAVVLISAVAPGSVRTLYEAYTRDGDASVVETASFLNTETPPGASVETYEGELLFLLNRPYHYPPNQVQVQLNRRTFLGQDVPIDYDPRVADPDYLVVGPHGRLWQLYEPVLNTGEFRLLQANKRYEIYQRIR